VEPDVTQQQIRELESLKFQKRLWQSGITLSLLLIVVVCILTLRGAVYGLTQDGPTRQQFVTDLSGRIQKDVVPNIEEMGAQALHEVNFQVEINKVNKRTPELTQASIKQLRQECVWMNY